MKTDVVRTSAPVQVVVQFNVLIASKVCRGHIIDELPWLVDSTGPQI